MEKDIGHTLNETQANKIRRPHYGKSSFVRWDNLVYVSTCVESDPKTILLPFLIDPKIAKKISHHGELFDEPPKCVWGKKSTAIITSTKSTSFTKYLI